MLLRIYFRQLLTWLLPVTALDQISNLLDQGGKKNLSVRTKGEKVEQKWRRIIMLNVGEEIRQRRAQSMKINSIVR
jgi:hypothetical protein